MKKKLIIILSVILIVIFSSITVIMLSNKYTKFEPYSKYSSSITLIKQGFESQKTILNMNYDGSNTSIGSNNLSESAIIIGDKLYYIKENIIYETNIKASENIYDIINNFKKIEEKNKNIYKVILDKKEVNQLLAALFINYDHDNDCEGSLIIENNKIIAFRINIDQWLIDIKFNELSEHFKVDTKVFQNSSNNPGLMKKIEKTESNPFIIN